MPLDLTSEDTIAAINAAIDDIIVSNHGGRQLDEVVTTMDALTECAAAAAGRVPVHVDGGIQKGSDIFKVHNADGLFSRNQSLMLIGSSARCIVLLDLPTCTLGFGGKSTLRASIRIVSLTWWYSMHSMMVRAG